MNTNNQKQNINRIFNLLNQDFFNNVLPAPTITVISSSKVYAHYVSCDIWTMKNKDIQVINISSALLNKPFDIVVTYLLHECVHIYNDRVLNVQDTSNKGVYHNKLFKKSAELHGLTVKRSEKYGYCITTPSNVLLKWIVNNKLNN